MHNIFIIILLVFYSNNSWSQAPSLFQTSKLNLPIRTDADVLPVFLQNPNKADLLVTQINEKTDERSIKIFSLTETNMYEQSTYQDIEIPDDVIFIDTGRVLDTGLESIILFRRNAAWIFNPVNGQESHLLDIQSLYKNPIIESLPHFDVIKDINGDSLEDILLPGFDGYQIFIQTEAGVFSEAININIPLLMSSTNEYNYSAIVYEINDPYIADENFDQKKDLFFWDPPILKAYMQNSIGGYSSKYKPIPLLIDIISANDLAKRMSREDQSNIKARTFHKVKDINNDGYPDLITKTIISKGVFNKKTTFEFFTGQAMPGDTISFSEQASSEISSKGFQIDPEEKDFNNDGKIDYVVTSIDIGIGMLIKALFTGSANVDLNFYQQTDMGFQDKPNAKHKLKVKFSLSSGDFYSPTILIIDVNGDDVLDLMVSNKDGFKLSYGDLSEQLFSSEKHEFEIPVPNDPGLVDTYDLNKDGKDDIILRYGDDKRGLQKTVNVLLSN